MSQIEKPDVAPPPTPEWQRLERAVRELTLDLEYVAQSNRLVGGPGHFRQSFYGGSVRECRERWEERERLEQEMLEKQLLEDAARDAAASRPPQH